jgi:hypothetical protein
LAGRVAAFLNQFYLGRYRLGKLNQNVYLERFNRIIREKTLETQSP